MSAGVVELRRDLHTLGVHFLHEVMQASDEHVVVDADRVAGGAAVFPVDGGVLEDDHPDATAGPLDKVRDQALADLAELGREARVHRCLDETVLQSQRADPAFLEKGIEGAHRRVLSF